MSFASQIISSVNNKNKTNTENTESTLSSDNLDTTIDTIPSTSETMQTSDNDIGFKTDIDTQIKQSNMQSNIKDLNEKSSDTQSSSKSNNRTSSMYTLAGVLPMITTNYFIIIIVILLVILHHYNIEVFGNLGDFLDNFIEIFYKVFKVILDAFQPLIDTVYVLLYGASKQSVRTVAVGAKEAANKNAEITDIITDPVLKDKSKNIKIDKKLKHDINYSSKPLSKIENDNAESIIQKKTDWCFIGEDQNVRKCVQVGDNKCLSGLVYKSSNDCINNV